MNNVSTDHRGLDLCAESSMPNHSSQANYRTELDSLTQLVENQNAMKNPGARIKKA